MFVISAPSGAGKSTLMNMLLKNDHHVFQSISVTTRKIRVGEEDGKDYFFVNHEEFLKMIKDDQFLEYAEICGNFYGTLKSTVMQKIENGYDVVFAIDWQGHKQLLNFKREDVASVFILPPSKKELFRRLTIRNQDSIETIQNRMNLADVELNHWKEYDYLILNDNLERSFDKLIAILKAERLRKKRRIFLEDFISGLIDEKITEN